MRTQRGFGYLELLLALVVLASAVAGAGLALQNHVLMRHGTEERAVAHGLVQEGLALARVLPRVDPESGRLGGLDPGQTNLDVNDVGDLHTRVESPPRDARGIAIGSPGEWERSYLVTVVDAMDLKTEVLSGALLHVQVMVRNRGRTMASGSIWIAAEH